MKIEELKKTKDLDVEWKVTIPAPEINIELDKSEQTSDWSQTKLTKFQIQYAINDVLYLYDIKSILKSKLEELNRLKIFNSLMKFMETRVELDLMGWESTDIFAHK